MVRILRSISFRIAVLIGAIGVVSACQKSLFPPDQPRTQFDAHDTLRNRYVPLEEPDVFGNPQPALRARLSRHR